MKKILYTLITALLLISCHDDEMSNTSPSAVEKGKVALNLSLYLPELEQVKSRSFSDSDDNGYLTYLQNCPLQLVVFDENGVLVEAHDITPTGYNGNDEVNFSVHLETSNETRHIHCIVNSPVKATEYEDFGLESDLIGELSKALDDENADDPTTDVNETSHQDAYWQLLVLDKIDNTDYTKSKLQRIPLIRNFVKISVNTTITDASHFELLGYAVVNEWNKGTVAPYKGGGFFASLIDDENKKMKDYPTITDTEKYEGVWPSDAQLINRDATTVVFQEFTSAKEDGITTYTGPSYYMYERRNTYADNNIPTTYLLIKGKYRGGGVCYYKLDFVYDKDDTGVNKEYYNLLRNFHYQINIEDVTGNGYATPKEAADHAASNNLIGAIDIRDLTNISDGVDRLFVSYTDYTVVDNTNPVEIKYRFLEGNNTFNNTGVVTSIKEQTKHPIKDVYYKKANGDIVYIYEKGVKGENYESNVDIPKDGDNWSTVYVTFESMPTDFSVYTNILKFSYKGLVREVDYNLRSIMPMIVECNPMNVREGIKQQVAVNILIPTGITGENDPYQLFPLEFWVEANQLTISPNVVANKDAITLSPSEMPVESGKSIIPNKNKQTFRYKRTITNEEYQTLVQTPVVRNGNEYVQIPCHFLTNTTNSETTVYAQNKYFELIEKGIFINGEPDALIDHGFYGVGQEAILTFTAVKAGTYTITSNNLSEPSRSVSIEVECDFKEQKTVSFVTDTWDDISKVTIRIPNGTEYDVMAEARKILPMKATTTLNGASFTAANSPTFQVYTDQTSALAWADNKVTDVTNSALTSTNGTSKEITGLKENTELWFAFQSGGFVYVASTTAGALANKTAVLAFTDENRVEIPLEWSAELTGEQYYGSGKTVTLTLTTNKPGTYNVSFAEVGTNGGTATITVAQGSTTGTATYTTQSWSGAISAVVTSVKNEELDVTGDERTWLQIGKLTCPSNNNPPASNTTVYLRRNNSNIASWKWSEIVNGTAEVEISNLGQNDNGYYFRYSTGSFMNTTNYNSDNLIASQMVANTEIHFTKQNGW